MVGEFGRIYLILVTNISTALLLYSELKVKEEEESLAYSKLLCPNFMG
jgi:hypothetical protein